MSPQLAKKLLPIIEAYANGEQLEFKADNPISQWKACNNPLFSEHFVYRVKPKSQAEEVARYLKEHEFGFLVNLSTEVHQKFPRDAIRDGFKLYIDGKV